MPFSRPASLPTRVLSEWGWVILDADKPAEADRVFARLLKEYPNSPHAADARFNLAESANLAHNYAEVVRLLKPLAAIKLADKLSEPAGIRTARPAPIDCR